MGDHGLIEDSMRCLIRISNFVLQNRGLGSQNLNSLVPLETHVLVIRIRLLKFSTEIFCVASAGYTKIIFRVASAGYTKII